jgi:hypothetical protein
VLVAAGLALEALAVAVLAGGVVVVAVRDQAADRAGAIALGLTAVLLAAGLAAVAAGVARGAAWSRSPALVWQVLQLAVAVPGIGAQPWLAVPAVVLAVAVGVGVLLDQVVPRQG